MCKERAGEGDEVYGIVFKCIYLADLSYGTDLIEVVHNRAAPEKTCGVASDEVIGLGVTHDVAVFRSEFYVREGSGERRAVSGTGDKKEGKVVFSRTHLLLGGDHALVVRNPERGEVEEGSAVLGCGWASCTNDAVDEAGFAEITEEVVLSGVCIGQDDAVGTNDNAACGDGFECPVALGGAEYIHECCLGFLVKILNGYGNQRCGYGRSGGGGDRSGGRKRLAGAGGHGQCFARGFWGSGGDRGYGR